MFLNRVRSKSNSEANSQRPSFSAHYKRKKVPTETKENPHDHSQQLYMKGDGQECERQNQIFNQTAQKLRSNNFAHHDEAACCCESCECGRHLCKFNVIKPGFTKKTIYKRSYYKQAAIKNVVNHDKEYERLKGPHLDMKSTYSEGFKQVRGDDLDRPHPEDLLHPHGPCQQVTSYSNHYPGFKGGNQYVKPTDKHSIAYFPLRSKSTYSKEYQEKSTKKDDYTYIPDQLRTGSNWFGRTTYSDCFNHPDAQYFAKKVKVVEKLEKNPDYNRQYRTLSLIQKPSTRTTSSLRRTRSARPRSSWRPRARGSSATRRASSARTATSRPFRRSTTRFPTPSTPTSD
jgi:hypothetical protein